MPDRPLEALKRAIGSHVLVRMRSGQEMRGKLAAFDDYMNLTLEESEVVEEGKEPKKSGTTHVKGDNLIYLVLTPSA